MHMCGKAFIAITLPGATSALNGLCSFSSTGPSHDLRIPIGGSVGYGGGIYAVPLLPLSMPRFPCLSFHAYVSGSHRTDSNLRRNSPRSLDLNACFVRSSTSMVSRSAFLYAVWRGQAMN